MNGDPTPNLLERMQLLQEQGASIQDTLRQSQKDVESKLAEYIPPDTVNVHVTLSDSGFPVGLTVTGPSENRTGAAFTASISSAFQLTLATGPTPPVEVSTAIIDAISSGEEPPSVTISDDLGQFSVTASFGNIRSVETTDPWVQSSTDELIAEEILRVAQQAAKASDAFHRFE